jgi:CSLREA domain-containing protein
MIALVLGLFFVAGPTLISKAATTINVTTFADETANDGQCSLREAIIAANNDKQVNTGPGECPAGSGADTIVLQAGTYTLSIPANKSDNATTGDLNISSDVTINGAGADKTTITGVNFSDRIFQILSGTSVFNGFTISGANLNSDGSGISDQANLTLNGVVITGNNATGKGGGIFVNSKGVLTINNSTIWGNTAQGSGGGGLALTSGTVIINNSTISGNFVNKSGGGIYQNGGTITLNNVTIANNTADNDASGTGDGGGVWMNSGTFNFTNSIIAGNLDKSPATISPDCAGTLTSQGYNLVGNTDGCTITGTTTGNLTGVDPQLGALRNNGGTTLTQAISSTSPALNAGNPATPGSGGAACLATDQIGTSRPQGSACDIGAFELRIVTLTINQSAGGTITASPAGPYTYGENVTLTAAPDANYLFGSWSGDCGGSSTTCNLVMNGNKTVSATFQLNVETLTINPSIGGSISADPAGPYTFGENVTLTAAPATGYSFTSWTGDCSSSTTPTCALVLNSDLTVGATFELIPVTLTINQSTGGTITASPLGPYLYGTNVTLTAAPATGYLFGAWTGDCSGATSTCNLQLNGDKTVSATYNLAPQAGPVFTVNNSNDANGTCYVLNCDLRQAIQASNSLTGGTTPNQILFNLPGGGAQTISPASALPSITVPVVIDATTVSGQVITIDGTSAGASDGLTISGGNSTLRGLTITHFSGNGVVLSSSGNLVTGNTITLDGKAGVLVQSGTGNKITSNSISGNGALGIDLGGDGVTQNDTSDADSGANNLQNFPVLTAAVPGSTSAVMQGRLNSTASASFILEFYSNTSCDASGFGQGQSLLGSTSVTTDTFGNANFNVTLPVSLAANRFISATATDATGNTSEFSQCIVSSVRNDSWPGALELTPGATPATANQYLDKQGQVRWYKFKVQPNSKVIVTLTNLPANYDLTLYKDIGQAFASAATTTDLLHLGAEFAADAFAPDTYSPDTYSPDTYSPDTYSPDTYSADIFSPNSASPATFSPDTYSPDTYSPDTYSPDTYSPDTYSPDTYSPDTYSPDTYSAAFSSAQTRSLIGVSAFDGTASEGIAVNTWDNSTYFYVRVRGRNGAYTLQAPFQLSVTQLTGQCSAINANFPASNTTVAAGNYKTIILTDMARLTATSTDVATIQSELATFAARPEVSGVIVDVNNDAAVSAANTQADANPACPSAKNLVANAIKNIVGQAAQNNPLQYVVIIGDDSVIPFFRHPDESLLANEQNFVPPVKDSTPSQASLKLGYFLSQDDYGSQLSLSSNLNTFNVPTLAVGRLVETPAEIETMLNAYLSTASGVVATPSSALVTGYDFLADAATAIQSNLQAGLGAPVNALITPSGISPADPSSWTASQLATALLGSRNDLVFLGGHFSAGTALAADYTTRLFASQVANSSVNLTNSIIFSAGCHAGYNVVIQDGVPQVTLQPDWPQAFASKGATLIAGTGYQYGDTDFIKYSEQLYLNFSQQLLVGSGPVSLGQALVKAKQEYLANTPIMRGIDQKAILESTLFGLPMLSVNMPSGRITPTAEPPMVTNPTTFTTNPGQTLGLAYADVSVAPNLTTQSVTMKDPTTGLTSTAQYDSGKDGVVSVPDAQVQPLDIRNASVPNTVLRGVGFRSGSYTDAQNVLPFTGAPTTELRSAHTPFFVDYFFPVRFWSVNYFGALTGANGGVTELMLEPSQYMSTVPGSITGTLRSYTNLGFRLFYSNNNTTYPSGNTPALSTAPAIANIASTVSNGTIYFQDRVVGDPAAGIQQVWITYTATSGPLYGTWQSLDLTQDPQDSTLWKGSLPLGTTNQLDFRYIVQAVNGVGLVNLATNLGAYYIPGYENVTATTPTSLSVNVPSSSGAYGTQASFSATLTSNGTPLSNMRVAIAVGSLTRQGLTDANGVATVSIPLDALPGDYSVRASFTGTPVYLPAAAVPGAFTIVQQNTQLSLAPQPTSTQYSDPAQLTADLQDASGLPISEQTVIFIISGNGVNLGLPVITDYAGRAPLGAVSLAPGTYSVNAYYSGTVPLPSGTIVLSDFRYKPSTASGTLTVTSEDATLAYTGSTAVAANTTLTLSAAVTQAADGYPGDLTTSSVQFSITSGGSTVIATASAPVSASGVASTTLPGLPVGLYQVAVSLSGGYFNAQPLSIELALFNPNPSITAGIGIFSSPAGYYTPNPTLSGNTSFAFYAYYPSGSTVPSGYAFINFNSGTLSFSSTSLNWLIITSGSQAFLSGSGTVNSVGGYGFLISVIAPSSGQQYIRIKIWDQTTGNVLYDTQPGAPDYAAPTTPTTGLSIVLQ